MAIFVVIIQLYLVKTQARPTPPAVTHIAWIKHSIIFYTFWRSRVQAQSDSPCDQLDIDIVYFKDKLDRIVKALFQRVQYSNRLAYNLMATALVTLQCI